MWPKCGQFWPFRPNSTFFGRRGGFGPTAAPDSTNLGRHCPHFGLHLTNLATSGWRRANLADFGHLFGQSWQTFAPKWSRQNWPNLARIRAPWATSEQVADNCLATLGLLRGLPGSSRVTSRGKRRASVLQPSVACRLLPAAIGLSKAAAIAILRRRSGAAPATAELHVAEAVTATLPLFPRVHPAWPLLRDLIASARSGVQGYHRGGRHGEGAKFGARAPRQSVGDPGTRTLTPGSGESLGTSGVRPPPMRPGTPPSLRKGMQAGSRVRRQFGARPSRHYSASPILRWSAPLFQEVGGIIADIGTPMGTAVQRTPWRNGSRERTPSSVLQRHGDVRHFVDAFVDHVCSPRSSPHFRCPSSFTLRRQFTRRSLFRAPTPSADEENIGICGLSGAQAAMGVTHTHTRHDALLAELPSPRFGRRCDTARAQVGCRWGAAWSPLFSMPHGAHGYEPGGHEATQRPPTRARARA